VAQNPNPLLPITSYKGVTRTLDDWATVFNLAIVVLPDRPEGASFVGIVERIFATFGDSDVRTIICVPTTPAIAKRILGPAVDVPWRHVDLAAHEVSATVVGKSQHDGKGSNVLGDPRLALTWLVNELSAHGVDIRAGEVVTTGTCVVPVPVVPGDEVRASFGDFGRLSVRFS